MTQLIQLIQGPPGPAGAPGASGTNIAQAGALVICQPDGNIDITPLPGEDIRFNTSGLGNLRVTGQTNLLLEGGDLLATGFEDAAPGRLALTNDDFGPGDGLVVAQIDLVSFNLAGGGPGPAAQIEVEIISAAARTHKLTFRVDTGAGVVDVLEFTGTAAVIPGSLAWGGGASIASSDIFSDYAGMSVSTGATPTVIPQVDSWAKVAAFTIDGPAVVSAADNATDAITVGGNGDYEIAFDTAASSPANNQVIHMAAFDVAAAGATITGVTAATPPVVTATGHGLTNGQKVKISGVGGMIELNDRIFTVAGVSGASFNLQDDAGVNINGLGFTAFSTGGTARLATDTGVHSIRKYATQDDVGAQASANVGTLTLGDTIELYVKNATSSADITIEEANFFIHRLG